MSFIDWSDSEEMLGLLAEYVADERGIAASDNDRREWLDGLYRKLLSLMDEHSEVGDAKVLESLQQIIQSTTSEFETDGVIEHLVACAEELQRIASESSDT